jgi:hypothetical protein
MRYLNSHGNLWRLFKVALFKDAIAAILFDSDNVYRKPPVIRKIVPEAGYNV